MSITQNPDVNGLPLNMDVLEEIVERMLVEGNGMRNAYGMLLCKKITSSLTAAFYRDVYAASDKALSSLCTLFKDNPRAREHVQQLYIAYSWVARDDEALFTAGPCTGEVFRNLAYNATISREHHILVAKVATACAKSLESLVLQGRRLAPDALVPLRTVDFTNITELDAPIDIVASRLAPHRRPIHFPRLRHAKFVIVQGSFWNADPAYSLDFTDYPSLERVYILITHLPWWERERERMECEHIEKIRVAAYTKYVAVELELGDLPIGLVGNTKGEWWVHPKLTFIVWERYITTCRWPRLMEGALDFIQPALLSVKKKGCTWKDLDVFVEKRLEGTQGEQLFSDGATGPLIVFRSKTE
ncbi:hypothetical protein V5O48_002519 [Marasmius crinis-equi]|uniref:Uncharacterized protein n=1 Tax=Marasmius crinis-equi TaxID=585013 RepID=A0ABR3FVV1_9AGAR